MAKIKKVIVTLTRSGIKLGVKIYNNLDKIDLYIPQKFKKEVAKEKRSQFFYYDSSLKELTAELFDKYSHIIYIMSLGIVVRITAPHLKNKRIDPAVVTIDETGQNVISTLSGHGGGANKLTKDIAGKIGANPVITTATDCQGKPALDLLASKFNCVLKPFSNLKKANGALVNGEQVNIFTDYNIDLPRIDKKIDNTDNLSIFPLSELPQKQQGFKVIISNKNFKSEYCRDISLKPDNYLQLIPRSIIIGIGCRKGVNAGSIEKAVTASLKKLNLKEESIKNLATIDLKKEEPGLLEFADSRNLEIDIMDREEIKTADLNINESQFVKKVTGVPGVCEPAALLSAASGDLILSKTSYNKVTTAVVEEEISYEK